MSSMQNAQPHVKLAVPFFMVKNMHASLDFYVNGLGCEMKFKWTTDAGDIKWCWLAIDDAALMLQEFNKESVLAKEKLGAGVEIYFICEDALSIYHQLIKKNISVDEPFV